MATMYNYFVLLLLFIPILIRSQYIFVSQVKTQTSANAYCQSTYGTTLASIHSIHDNKIVQNLCSSASASVCWIGLVMVNNSWAWFDETSQDFYQMQDDTYTFTGTVIQADSGNWNDWNHDSPLVFICNTQYIINDEQLSAHEQEMLCDFRYDSHLASIHNNFQNKQIDSLCNTEVNTCWIGLHDTNAESSFEWTDQSLWDYGTNVSQNDGDGPWIISQPDNYAEAEDCVTMQKISANIGWNDEGCSVSHEALCNYPATTYIFDDPAYYERIPTQSQTIGEMKVLDNIFVEFYAVIKSFQTGYTSILHIGNEIHQYSPAIWISEDDHKFYFSQSYLSTYDNYVLSQVVQLNTVYHIKFYFQQDYVKIIVNDTVVSDVTAQSHEIYDANIYLSSPWLTASDVVVSGLKITSSNSNKPDAAYNYLCDFSNRFTHYGTWTPNGCSVYSPYATPGTNTWLGSTDESSLEWTDYKIEAIFTFHSGTGTAGITFRNNGATTSRYLEGTTYNWYIYRTDQTIKLATVVDGYNGFGQWNTLLSSSFSITDGQTYTLRVDVSSDYISCYANHKLIGTVTNSAYSSGSVGLQQYMSSVTFWSLRIMFTNSNQFYSVNPTPSPTQNPTQNPTTFLSTTSEPTSINPTINPSVTPTHFPTLIPTSHPTTNAPTFIPTLNPTIIPTLIPTINPTSYAPTLTPTLNTNDGNSGEQHESVTTQNIASNDEEFKNSTQSMGLLYMIAIGACVLCCCLMVSFFVIRCKKWRKQKKDQTYLGPTDLVEITSISSIKQDNIEPIGQQCMDSLAKSSEAMIMEDIAEIVHGTTPMGLSTEIQPNNGKIETNNGGQLAIEEGIDTEDVQVLNEINDIQENVDMADTVGDIETPMMETKGSNVGNDEFIVHGNEDIALQNIDTDEGTTDEDDVQVLNETNADTLQ